MKKYFIFLAIFLLVCPSLIFFAKSFYPAVDGAGRFKVELDLEQLDEHGLRGALDGKVSVSYEFCIPNTVECKARVKAIDETAQFMPGSRGRIGAGADQCLCVGSTHQKNYRAVLYSLAELSCVGRIIVCDFE
ncbi:MAG: hypothetical protein PHV05_09865 [Candidatus Riflebacteria bacterium]|nr:hypothetical protein [Candidatus Riflebacteria bacterium]